MAWKILVVSLTGSAQRLSDSYTNKAVGGKDDIPLRAIWMQPRGTNAQPIYVGDSSTVSDTNYGVRLPASAAGVPPAPFPVGNFETGPLKLSDFYVLGTAGEFLHLSLAPF